ncbi:MAG: N-acetyl-D-Glu racemase DgcA [Pseudomonadota bacterium]
MARHVDLALETWQLKRPFSITGKTMTHVELLIATIEEDGHCGRGEAAGIFYLGETGESMAAQAKGVAQAIESGATRQDLVALLPNGGARNALDCALWDLDAKHQGKSIWNSLGLVPNTKHTVMTIGIDTPERMAKFAASYENHPVLKIKLDGHAPLARLSAVRTARPDAALIVDANQGFDAVQLQDLIQPFAELNIAMLEQPLPRGADDALLELDCPFPLCADESCLDLDALEIAAQRYQMINIKLDKTGGLTHALALTHAAKAKGLGLMVGNMHGTSLAMAPAFIIAQYSDFVDLDGPLLLKQDRSATLDYAGSKITWPDTAGFWGMPQ